MKEIKKILDSKNFDYQKARELYLKHSKQVRVLPINPTPQSIHFLKSALDEIYKSKKSPVDDMNYDQMLKFVAEHKIEVPSKKSEDIYVAIKEYMQNAGS